MSIIAPRCKSGDMALVVRNTRDSLCHRAAVGRYVVVVRQLGFDDEGRLLWTYDGPPKPCAVEPTCQLRFFADADLQPLPDPGYVETHDKRLDIDLAAIEDAAAMDLVSAGGHAR